MGFLSAARGMGCTNADATLPGSKTKRQEFLAEQSEVIEPTQKPSRPVRKEKKS